MGRFRAPEQRRETPFLVAARNGNVRQETWLRIAVAHGIIDQSQVKDYDPTSLLSQLQENLTPEQLKIAIAALADGQGEPLRKLTHNPRVIEWMPGGNKSRVAKNKKP